MRIQAAPDLLLATADNAAAGAIATEGDKAQGGMFAQLMQALPATAGAVATDMGATVTAPAPSSQLVAVVSGEPTRIDSAPGTAVTAPAVVVNATVELPAAIDLAQSNEHHNELHNNKPVVAALVTEQALQDSAVDAVADETTDKSADASADTSSVALTTPDFSASDEAAATSARMMSALRREFVPTPVLSPLMTPPANNAAALPAKQAQQLPVADRTAAGNESKTVTAASASTISNTAVAREPAHARSTQQDKTETANTAAVAVDSTADTATATTSLPDDKILSAVAPAPATAANQAAGNAANNSENSASASPMPAAQPQLTTHQAATSTTVATASTGSQTLPAEFTKPAVANGKPASTRGTTNSLKASGNHGAALPASGKGLPLSAAHASNNSTLIDLAALPISIGETVIARTDIALPGHDNAALRSAASFDSAASTASMQLPTTANTLLGAERATPELPPVFTSTFVMGTAGWSEETAQHIRWMQDDDMQSADIQLHPAELGRIDISIDIKDGQTSVNLVAGSAEARELLEKALPSLRELLAQSGMSLGNSHVAADHNGRDPRAGRFNAPMFQLAETPVAELQQGRPALFRASGGSHRIDYYV